MDAQSLPHVSILFVYPALENHNSHHHNGSSAPNLLSQSFSSIDDHFASFQSIVRTVCSSSNRKIIIVRIAYDLSF